MTSSVCAVCASIAAVDIAQVWSGARMMDPPDANPTTTNPVVHWKSLRFGVVAFIGFLPHDAPSGTPTLEWVANVMPAAEQFEDKLIPPANAHKAAFLTDAARLWPAPRAAKRTPHRQRA